MVTGARRPRPFVPWVGGKTPLVPTLGSLLPARMERYIEPFVGGGALFFAVPPSCDRVIADVNEHLVNAYRSVATDVDAVIEYLEGLCPPTSPAEYRALADRAVTSASGPEQAALFIATVKSTFGAKWEIDAAGRHRGTWSKRHVQLCDPRGLRLAATHLQGAAISCGHYNGTLDGCDPGSGDLVYLDPPYLPEPAGTFTGYTQEGFGVDDHRALSTRIDDLCNRGAFVMLSINDTPAAREIYPQLDFRTALAPRRLRAVDRVGRDLVGLSYLMPG